MTTRQAIQSILSSPGVLNAAGKALYESDTYDGDRRWESCSPEFRSVYVEEIENSLTTLLAVLPENDRNLRAA